MISLKQFSGMIHTLVKPIIRARQNPIFLIEQVDLTNQYQIKLILYGNKYKERQYINLLVFQYKYPIMKRMLFFGLVLGLLVTSNCFSMSRAQDIQQIEQQEPILQTYNKTKLLWPLPTKITLNETAEPLQIDPCHINYVIQATPQDYVKQILNLYLIDVFKCKQIIAGKYRLNIVVKNSNQMVAQQLAHEKYSITIRGEYLEKWDLTADYYVGFLRGMETFSQLFEKKNGTWVLNGRPISIDDSPNYLWRGLMIDTSRHFLSVPAIKHVIDGLLYNKMSVLHWHLIDEDSFPLEVQARPELSQYGKLSGTYSRSQIKSIINYAKIRGVRVIPQFDTPAHTQSWGRSSTYKNIVVKCNNQYQGQFDPTLDLTYDVVTDVMKEVNTTFIDAYAHFGGDQIDEDCYTRRPSIKQWMDKNNVTTYLQLSNYYRKRQKSIWKTISPFKKAIYWANEQIDMPLEADDVIHWWGVSKNVDRLSGRKNEVILSNYDITYLDLGYGGRRGAGYGSWISWRDLYKFNPKVNNVNVIGGETCMWSQISNQEVQDQKVWIRTAVLNERLWNVGINGTTSILNIVQRLSAHGRRLKERGFKVQPVTVGLCEKDPSICFGNG